MRHSLLCINYFFSDVHFHKSNFLFSIHLRMYSVFTFIDYILSDVEILKLNCDICGCFTKIKFITRNVAIYVFKFTNYK